MRIPLRAKALGAVAAATLMVGLAAAPAPAGTVTSASITIDGTTFPIGGAANPNDANCVAGSNTVSSTVSGTPGTFSVSGISMSGYFRPSGTDRWRITVGFAPYGGEVTAGSVSGGGAISGSDLVLSFTLEDYEDGTGAGQCDSLGNGVCDGVVGLLSGGTYATNGGNPDTVSLTGGSAGSTGGDVLFFSTGCGAAVGRFDGKAAVLNSLLAVTP